MPVRLHLGAYFLFLLVPSAYADGVGLAESLLLPKPLIMTGEPIATGNVVIQGEYINPPYRVSLSGNEVFINDVRIVLLTRDKNVVTSQFRRSATEFVTGIERTLFWGSTLVVFDQQTRLVVDSTEAETFWASMAVAKSIEEKVQIIFEQADYDEFAKNSIPTAQWRVALENFDSSESLSSHFEPGCLALNEVSYASHVTSNETKPALLTKLDLGWLMYLLNSSGMLLAVISLSVLITNPPNANGTWIETSRLPSAYQLVKKCLTLTLVLSIFDLVSTLTADSAGGFAESNPLAAFLLVDPLLLTGVKLFGTCLIAGLLWAHREYVGVQLASWWICFVLTLVTIRWVVVDSLFYV